MDRQGTRSETRPPPPNRWGARLHELLGLHSPRGKVGQGRRDRPVQDDVDSRDAVAAIYRAVVSRPLARPAPHIAPRPVSEGPGWQPPGSPSPCAHREAPYPSIPHQGASKATGDGHSYRSGGRLRRFGATPRIDSCSRGGGPAVGQSRPSNQRARAPLQTRALLEALLDRESDSVAALCVVASDVGQGARDAVDAEVEVDGALLGR